MAHWLSNGEFRDGPQSYSKNWLFGLKKFLFAQKLAHSVAMSFFHWKPSDKYQKIEDSAAMTFMFLFWRSFESWKKNAGSYAMTIFIFILGGGNIFAKTCGKGPWEEYFQIKNRPRL